MTSPDRFVPHIDDGNAEANRVQSIFAGGLTALDGPVIGKALKSIAAALSGAYDGNDPNLLALRDGQLALNEATHLLLGVRGYCAAYQTVNVNLAWGNDNTRILPFKSALGPSLAAHVDERDGGIILEDPGLWLIGAKIHVEGSGIFAGANEVRLTIRVFRPTGTEYTRSTFRAQPGSAPLSIAETVPIVVPGPGYRVAVEMWAGRWRWITGGTEFSRLWVIKQDNRTDNAGQPTVPNEPAPPGAESEQA
ncbi:hypothetical protein [Corynebacterium freneyi]|uniref:hypothetical protein n=1 Tax=Corynebacterium freneyi TaxID=134034 RepID=UPI001CCE7901|nr:hypothetical protein [Corynebacterium freneyi]UBI01553.1 hypothetical protein LA334_08455 [Corynebacterium freneyi]